MKDYVYDVNTSLPVVLDDGTRKYVYGLGLAYAVSGAALEVYHTDGLGSVRAITDGTTPAPLVVQTYATDEFGIPDAAGTQGSTAQPFQYTGEPRDAETGFVHLRARLYDPQVGRFLQRDPFAGSREIPRTLNRYAYVGGNPVSRIDPSGLCEDPGGSGIRYCIERYIPTKTTSIPLPLIGLIEFTGDDRGPSSSGGTFKLRQFISLRLNGSVDYAEDVGWTTILGRREQGILVVRHSHNEG
jgi:RHS repeat-associated protein